VLLVGHGDRRGAGGAWAFWIEEVMAYHEYTYPGPARSRITWLAVNGLLDEARMANAEALRALGPLIEGKKLDALDLAVRIGRAVHAIHTNDRVLTEIERVQEG